MANEYIVNASIRRQRAAERVNGDTDNLQGIFHVAETETDETFPRLEAFLMTLRKNPYAAIGVMIAIATLVITALSAVAVSMFAAIFMMYGTMNQSTAKLDVVIKTLDEAKTEQKVMRTYTASTLSRQNFMVGLMSRDQQKAVAEYDRNNPINPPAEKDQ